MSSDRFWINDLSVLYKKGNFVKIIPSTDMTKSEKLNAIARFCILMIIVLLIVERTSNWIYIAALVVLVTIVIHVSGRRNDERYSSDNCCPENDEIKVGRFDQNGQIIFDHNDHNDDRYNDRSDDDTQTLNSADSAVSVDSLPSCKAPTKNNPFMNGDVEEIGKYTPVACNADDEDIKSQISDAFNENLFKNMTDLFELKNSERQFYTVPVPNGIPDTVKFAKWAYGGRRNCKVDQKDCVSVLV